MPRKTPTPITIQTNQPETRAPFKDVPARSVIHVHTYTYRPCIRISKTFTPRLNPPSPFSFHRVLNNPIQPNTLSYPSNSNRLNRILDLLLARPLEDMREVADGNAKREIERGEHDGEEDPPAGQGGDEGEGAARLIRVGIQSASYLFCVVVMLAEGKRVGGHTMTSRPALLAAIVFSAFSYARARFQYAAARQPKAPTRERKMRKKVMFVRREQMRKMKQTRPMYARWH